MLQNDYLVAKIGVAIAENEPRKGCCARRFASREQGRPSQRRWSRRGLSAAQRGASGKTRVRAAGHHPFETLVKAGLFLLDTVFTCSPFCLFFFNTSRRICFLLYFVLLNFCSVFAIWASRILMFRRSGNESDYGAHMLPFNSG